MTTNNETPIRQEVFYQLYVTLDRPLVCAQCGETDQWYGVMEAGLHQPTSYACACGGSHLDPSEVNYWRIIDTKFGELMKEVLDIAYAKHPSGPFIPYPWPLIVGFIDADVFEDTDGSYIFYSAGCDDTQGAIWGQRLTPDGLSFMGEQVKLIEAEYDYEGNVVEGSVLLKRNGVYVMLYSINGFSSSRYAIHYAVSDDPLGPYSKPRDNCVLRACSGVDGPGHCDVSWPYMVFHGWHPGKIGYHNGHYRALYTAELEWNGVRPVVKRENEHACAWA